MRTNDATFQRALSKHLVEVLNGPPGKEAFILNPGDPGFLRQLESIDAEAASARPMAGKTTIAAHVDHVCYGLTLLNRWAAGETNPWADADWDASWTRTSVTDDQWRALRDRFRREVEAWECEVERHSEWDDTAAAGALASAAHSAYPFGRNSSDPRRLGKVVGPIVVTGQGIGASDQSAMDSYGIRFCEAPTCLPIYVRNRPGSYDASICLVK